MNKAVKRFAALFLALAMMLTLLPGAAFAQGEGETPAFAGTMHVLTGPSDALEESGDMTNSIVGTMQNNSFGLRFRTADGAAVAGETLALAGVVFGDGSGTVPENTFTVSPAADYINVAVSADAPVGNYALTFTVDGAAAVLNVSVAENGQGGTDPVPGPPVVEYRRAASETPDFQPAPTDGAPLTIEKDEAIFLRVTQDGEPLEVTATLTANGGQATLEALDGKVVKVTGGNVNGSVNVQFTFASGNWVQPLFVTGNETAPEGPSDYTSAQVRQAFADSGTVTFAEVSGEAAGPLPEGFSLQDGVLSFDTAGKQPGLYETVVGGKTYAVAVMRPLSGADASAATVTMSGYAPASLGINPEPGAYACLSSSKENISAANSQLIFQPGGQGTYDPIYIYLVENKTGSKAELVDVGDMCTIFGAGQDVSDCFEAQVVSLQGAQVLKLTVKENVPASATLNGYVNVYDASGRFVQAAEFAFVGANADRFGFTADPALAGSNNSGALRPIDQRFTPDNAPESIRLYLTKGSGTGSTGGYAQYDLALYDEVDAGSLTVTSSNNAFVDPQGYLASTPDGKNAIGFELKVKEASAPAMAEITVSFNDRDGVSHTYKGVVRCAPAQAGESCTVSTVEEFLEKYNSMTSGTIVMKGGTYSMDLVHDRYIAIRAAEGEEVIINGSEDGAGAIITIGLTNPGEISGITIDGRGKTRDGIAADGKNCYAYGITVQNCNTGMTGSPGGWAMLANGSTFRDNTFAIQAKSARLVVENCLFEGSGIAAIFIERSAYTECRVQMNRFVENTTDIATGNGYDGVTATQNYWQHGGAATKPKISNNPDRPGKVYYSPRFADEAMTLYTADLEGAVPGSTGYTVPVDRTLSDASLLDSALFAEMKSKTAAVSIPVTETVGDKALVTTVWGFDSGKLAEKLPDTMDLEVTDTLSAKAQAVVDKVVENPEAIAQAVNFSHDGALPGTATVMVRKTGAIKADELKLYYINETTGTVEQAEIVAVSATTLDGVDYYVVTVAHCSEYLIAGAITLKEEGGSTGGSEGGNTGSTGGESTPAPTAAPTAAPAATPAPTQAPASANKLVSALEVEERFAGAQSNEVAFDVARKPLVSAGAFGILAQNPDKALVLEGEGYAWRFEGAALTDPGAIEGASFDTTVSLTSPNAHLIAPLVKDVPAVNVYFSYHGALPGPAQVSVQLGAEHAGSVKYLYYFNSTAVTLEYVGEAKVDASGVATFTIEHCSDYVLLDEKLEETDAPAATPGPEATAAPEATQAPAAQETGAPSGGSTGFILAAVAAAAVLAAVILLLVRRRKGE